MSKNPYKAVFETLYRFADYFQVFSHTRHCSERIKTAEMAVLSLAFDPVLEPLDIQAKLEISKPLLRQSEEP